MWKPNREQRLSITVLLAFVAFVAILVIAGRCAQGSQKIVNEKDRIFSAHVAELRSMATTEVVTKVGSVGFISNYWSQSGLSTKYTLDEYKAAVLPLAKGTDVNTPVEGDRFLVPWPTE